MFDILHITNIPDEIYVDLHIPKRDEEKIYLFVGHWYHSFEITILFFSFLLMFRNKELMLLRFT